MKRDFLGGGGKEGRGSGGQGYFPWQPLIDSIISKP